uniref:Uncharacterized protein n=1 Tax=Arundo donax TaxID=35708 RepID=A0A0A9FED7_ARUDO
MSTTMTVMETMMVRPMQKPHAKRRYGPKQPQHSDSSHMMDRVHEASFCLCCVTVMAVG